jgi:hypothetical protein
VGHLPKRSLEDILRQRARVLRGREETWWERRGSSICDSFWDIVSAAFVVFIYGGSAAATVLLVWSLWKVGME